MTQKIFYATWSAVGMLGVILLAACIWLTIRIVLLVNQLSEFFVELEQSGVLEDLLRSF